MTHYKSLVLILSTCKYVTSSHVISSFFIEKYLYFYDHYKLLISILSTYKYATLSHAISSFFIEKYLYFYDHYKSLILILSTYKYITSSYTMSSFFIENISENSRSMPHHLSPLQNNSKKSRKLTHVT
jgi:hypothetical protein